ncbi:MAG: hypothetical protein AAB523_00525 [Patescibacteria group bacterium]
MASVRLEVHKEVTLLPVNVKTKEVLFPIRLEKLSLGVHEAQIIDIRHSGNTDPWFVIQTENGHFGCIQHVVEKWQEIEFVTIRHKDPTRS